MWILDVQIGFFQLIINPEIAFRALKLFLTFI